MYRAQSIILLRHINRRSFTNNTKACSYPQCWGRTLLSLNGNGYNVKNKLLKSSSNLHINNVRFISCSYRLYDKADNGGTEPSKETKRSKVVYFFKNIRYLSSVFLNGCKNLFLDVRVALQTRRKLGLFHQHDYSRLTRDEIHHMYQTKADVVKTFPFALFFMLPLVGYFAPLLVYFYPKIMSSHFWLPDQEKDFLLEEYERRSQYYLSLIKECAVTCKEHKSKELYDMCLYVIKGNHPTNNELLRFKDEFARFEDFSLQKVPRYHLIKLCKCWLIPTGWFVPRWYMMIALQKRIKRMHQDDMLILHEGAHQLSHESIAKAVHLRGLDESALNLPSMIVLLDEWVKLSSQATVRDVSFLAHCAAFKGANFEQVAKKNGLVESFAEK